MARAQTSPSAAIRARLDHPVIDADGHMVECEPLYLDYLQQVAGADLRRRYVAWSQKSGRERWYRLSPAERFAPTRRAFTPGRTPIFSRAPWSRGLYER